MQIFFLKWNPSDYINLFILIVYAVMAYLMYITYRNGQKLSKAGLSISEYNIIFNDLQSLITEAKEIKFKSYLNEAQINPIKYRYDQSDGVFYIKLFLFVTLQNQSNKVIYESEENKFAISDFRDNVLFPLERFYDKLNDFLFTVHKDVVLEEYHKKFIFKTVERDLLQTYFRVCNNIHPFLNNKEYQLSHFKTEAYNPEESFYRINKFYIENKLFNYKDLEFYQTTK
jgi:hypothetical protein